MKNFIVCLTLLISGNVFGGDAVIPFWQQNQHVNCTFNVSNVSGVDSEVEIRFYKEDGTLSSRSEKILAGTPMGRFGDPEECAGTLLYLVDPKLSGFVTGAVIPIDGGFSSYCGV